MKSLSTREIHQPDPAAVFAISHSLWEAFVQRAAVDPRLNLSECCSGFDGFMREIMRIAELFENWACAHIAFEELSDVWPYLLEDRFGETCLEIHFPGNISEFDETDCLRVATRLCLPIRVSSR